MTGDDFNLLQFWGKTPRTGEPDNRFHPAIHHMIDVALVAEALLQHGAPRLRRALLHAWHGCDPDLLLAWLPFLIATHDLGKISAAFQGQVDAQRERLAQMGVRFNQRKTQLYHAEISALWLHREFQDKEQVPAELMWVLRDAMGGHHGRFSEADMCDIRKRLHTSERGEMRWDAWREQSYTLLREHLAPAGSLADLGVPQKLRPATIALTGFIVWCDWMGSNEYDFPATPDLSIEQYLSECRRRADAALDLHHLRNTRPAPTSYPGFTGIFPDLPRPPRPLQALVDALPEAGLERPLLAVIEAPTGEGKTEAALALTRRIAAARGIDEIFFALPTMATGNQMFTRLESFYHGAVRLTHSQAIAIEEDLRRQVRLAGDQDTADPDGSSAAAALEWFVGSKKAMLAPFGVGTVDQVELGGLNVRHYPLRLFGLAGKVVIVDEIHAYDAYMSTILDQTITWLASLGCSVMLLSATLPAARHQALASAFLRGLDVQTQPDLPEPMPYPALSLYSAETTSRESCAVFRGEQRFTLHLAEQRTPVEEATYLYDLVREGGAVARLCNRVDDAQALYQALLNLHPTADHVLLHARFPLEKRREREKHINTLVGKETARGPAQPVIVVGTQVLEQSLDYDVDVMISDFAPIDLLLQRAGRLHRHNRTGQRPPRHTLPVLEVTAPRNPDGRPEWERWAPIYAPYILWRTWEVLHAEIAGTTREIVLPRDYRPLIEAVYAANPDQGSGAYAEEVAQAFARYRRETEEQQAQARRPLIPSAMEAAPIVEYGGRHFIDDESGQIANWQLAKTRLGDRISLVPVYRVGDVLSLDPGGTFQIPTDATPNLDQQKDLLNHAVPLSDRRIIAAYRDDKRERDLRWPWRDMPALVRSLHPLPLDPLTRTATIQGVTLRLDDKLGLVIEKSGTGPRSTIEEEL